MSKVLEQWFAREVLVHEPSLMRYLRRVWSNRDEVADLRQEIYVRVFESALKSLPTSPKAFLFTLARHLMIDRMRRGRVIFIGAREDLDMLNFSVDELSPERRLSSHQELARLAQAFDQLPPKCRTVMWLRKIEQLTQRQVATQLGIHEKAVEKQVARGMRLLANAVLTDLEISGAQGTCGLLESESDHG